jgi:non-specific serine/threonine protein kinase
LRVAGELAEEFTDGVWLVELAALTEASLVAQTVAFALGVREEPGRSLTETLVSHLAPRSLLLVLDNCEHLLSACAHLAAELLRRCGKLCILATSRQGMGIVGEQTYRVPPLAMPAGGETPSPERLQQYDAVQLFIDRATLNQPGFALTEGNAGVVAQVCARLEGMPLAIELAAARVKALPVEQIARRLEESFRLLTGGCRTALPRQQTLRATMDWSYDLLSKAERALLRRLSVFAGGWTLEAAEGVCAGEGIEVEEVLDLLTLLVEKSLVQYEADAGEARYRLLETVRQYGRERLIEAGEAEAVRRRHRGWFLALAEKAEPHLRGTDEAEWGDSLDQELDNLRAALEGSIKAGEVELELRLATALLGFWLWRSLWEEGGQWLEGALARSEPLARNASRAVSKARAVAFWGAARIAWLLGDQAVSRSRAEESVRLCRELGDKHQLANSLCFLCFQTGDRSVGEESATLFREVGDQRGLSVLLRFLGNWARKRGEYEQARALYEESLAIAREFEGYVAGPLAGLGELAWS